MPTLLRWKNYRFFFYSKENGEPPHIHIEKGIGEGQLKLWLENLNVAKCKGFADHELNEVRKAVVQNKDDFLEAWYEHFRD